MLPHGTELPFSKRKRMKQINRIQIALTVISMAVAAAPAFVSQSLARDPAAVQRAGTIGVLKESSDVVGADLKDKANKTVGKVDDVVVDLESGKILYVIANPSGTSDHVAIAPSLVNPPRTGKGLVATVDQAALKAAPKVDLNQTNDLGKGSFVSQLFQAFGLSTDVDANGSFQNVHKVTALRTKPVKNSSNADFGKLDEIILDFQGAHVPFVILTHGGASYPIPPNALTLSPDKLNLVTGLDENTLASAPKYTKGNVQTLANAATANSIYTHYGKQPYFNATGLTPTSRTNAPSQIFPQSTK